MWEFFTRSRNRSKAGPGVGAGSRMYRPNWNPLEERCLLAVALTGSQPAVPLVGSPVVWTAAEFGHGATPVYQFRVGLAGGPLQVVSDFSDSNSFKWDPTQEGTYVVQVTVKDAYTDPTGETATAVYTAASRVVGSEPVVSPTSNPLVALFSAPPSTASSMYVQFAPVGANSAWTSTSPRPVVPGLSTNFMIAGMYPNTTYVMRDVASDGTVSAPVTFTTGSPPSYLNFPSFTVVQAPLPGADLGANVVFHMGINAPPGYVDTLATDRVGNVIWYYDEVANNYPNYATSVLPGGTVLLLGRATDGTGGAYTMREINLAGDTLRETNISAINAQLATLGQPQITDLSHDIQRLPNGDTAVLAATTQTVNYQGKPTPYTADMVLVLDQNFQVVWTWNPFKWLDTNRLPTLGEGPADWTHSNSIAYSPEDGNLIVSIRHQDWVVKIDYANGTGNGHIIWRLGQGGDFTVNSTDPSPWFSHQHDVRYINDNTIMVFDDGNTRHSTDPTAHSRGQEWVINEKTMQATLVANVDLGSYSSFMGSAEMLPNGNLVFGSVDDQQTIETLPDGTKVYGLKDDTLPFVYRSYIYPSLYTGLGGYTDPYSVDLSSAFNRTGIVNDGAGAGTGLDTRGAALPSTQIGPNVIDGNAHFLIGPIGLPDAVSAAGQVIGLPVGNFNALKLLATGVNGAQMNQVFRVTYTDGTSQLFRRSFSDMSSPRRFPGEWPALTTSYVNVSGQGPQGVPAHVYLYTLKLNPRKTVQSITLPNNPNVVLFAATVIPAKGSVPATGPVSNAIARHLQIQQRQVQMHQQRTASLNQGRHLHPPAAHANHPALHGHGGASSAPRASLALRLHSGRIR